MSEFNKKVLQEIESQCGNARFPCPVSLCYSGEPTPACERLGISHYDEDKVYKAIKQLHTDGKIKYVERWGYSWVVPEWMDVSADEVVENPSGVPYNWERL